VEWGGGGSSYGAVWQKKDPVGVRDVRAVAWQRREAADEWPPTYRV
jgi:hypothetical protein